MLKAAAIVFVLNSTMAFAQSATIRVIPAPPDVAAPPADATKAPSGLAWKVIEPGTGQLHPAKDEIVTVHWTGWTTDGKMFDSSVSRGQPNTFRLDRTMPGWAEGVQLMVEGETRRFWIPQALAYKGQEGRPKGMVVFDIQLMALPVHPPADVKSTPADAKRTASGLAYKVLQEGVGARHPSPTGSVTVHYTGWTTDGKMFDSSVVNGKPATFELGGVIEGWTEGLQLMVENQKMRFWIPENLAYKGRGPVNGMLVFDIELLKIN
jgi:FKBP-type peptidyl-prolyl cis-trans isomerase